MLKNRNMLFTVIINIAFILIWDFIIFCLCKMLNESHFDYKKNIYKVKYWENNGKWYDKKLKIKVWKDFLPQYVSKNGFSKKNLSSLSLNYIDRFILETCRAEWAHKNCIWIAIFLIFINKTFMGITFVMIVLLINLPYICIQRYNRIRLIKVREKVLKLMNRDESKSERKIDFVRNFKIVDSQ